MRRRSVLSVGALFLALSLSACASTTDGAGVMNVPAGTTAPAGSSESPELAAARAQVQAWLDAAALPPGAVRSAVSIGGFTSYTAWPCGPVEKLEAFWTIPHTSVADAANWLRDHPTAGLMTTAVGPVPDDPAIDSASVGYIPKPDAQQGIVYTIRKAPDGVVVRAEIAATTSSASCPPVPGGGSWGAPGQG